MLVTGYRSDQYRPTGRRNAKGLHQRAQFRGRQVLDSVWLQNERDFGTLSKSRSAGVGVYLKRTFISGRAEDPLFRFWILLRPGGTRSDINAVCDQEAAVESNTECTDEISSASGGISVFGPVQELRSPGLGKSAEVCGKFILCHSNTSIYLR